MTYLSLINRNAILVAYKQPFIDWIKRADPAPHPDQGSDDFYQEENTLYLLPEFGDAKEMWQIIEGCYEDIFANELYSWYTDEDLWPENRSFELFKEWFDIKAHSMIYDLVDDEIVKEEE